MIEQAIKIVNNEICVALQFFIHKDCSFTQRELLLDAIAEKYHAGMKLKFYAPDGENLKHSGFYDFLELILSMIGISEQDLIIESHLPIKNNYTHKKLVLGIFVTTGKFIPDFEKNLELAKFVGASFGRFTVPRLRLAYLIDKTFADDNFLVFQPNKDFVSTSLRHVESIYTEEIKWVLSKSYQTDLTSNHINGNLKWQESCENYPNIWNRYNIEIISETDALSTGWYTEKTARCLATGKPFVLFSGPGSLLKLKEMGFYTFDSVIDESYDEIQNLNMRIKYLINSLRSLYNSPDRQEKIKKMYDIAYKNIAIYRTFCQNQREQ